MTKNNDQIFKSLNKKQVEAVKDLEHNIRIIAGPGSGKTRTITHKIAYLINKEIKSYNILAVTFTNKASKEMKHRVQELVGDNDTRIYTFHGLCANILYKEHNNTPYGSEFHIIDRKDQEAILKKIYKKRDLSTKTLKYGDVLKQFSLFNNLNKDIKNLYDNLDSENIEEKLYIELYEEYIEEKVLSKALDFNDLLTETLKLFKSNNEVKEKWSNYFKYIFVDEYQDTNEPQYKLLLLLKNVHNIINVVGDPDQNIYSFRGSELKFILNFEKDFKNTKTIMLDTNYRSTKSIVDLSNSLIQNNKHRVDNKLISFNGQLDKTYYYDAVNKISEAQWILRWIKSILGRNPNYKIAVLYRNNYVSAIIEKELSFAAIGYNIIGSLRFSERKEIKELISYMLFLLKYDDMSFERIISVPSRGIGPVALSKLNNLKFQSKYLTLWETIKDSDNKLVTSNYKLIEFIEHTKKAMKKLDNNENLAQIILSYISDVGLMKYYSNEENRVRNMEEFFDMMNQYVKTHSNQDAKSLLIKYINENQLFSSSDKSIEQHKVTLSTIHASKGLEFDAVFIASFNEGLLPHKFAISEKDIEEERRIAYVGITRAKKNLYFSSHRGSDFNGEITMASSFLENIKSHIEIEFDKKLENSYEVGDNYRDEINYFKSNEFILGDQIYHSQFGEGIIVKDNGDTVNIAFDKKVGVKEFLKNHISLRRLE